MRANMDRPRAKATTEKLFPSWPLGQTDAPGRKKLARSGDKLLFQKA
jgi:hypothetical protein